MSEKLEIYDLDENLIEVKERDEFYKEIKEKFKKTGKITKQVKRVLLLLMNSQGKIVLQRRSLSKQENSGLFDKTIGGHVEEGCSYEVALIKECAEELGYPVSILGNNDFSKSLKKTDLKIVGICKKIDYNSNFKSIRVTSNGEKFIQPYMQTIYMGYCNSSIQFIDGESSGIQLYTIKELEDAIRINPNDFTNDLKILFEKYKDKLKPII